MSLSRLGLARTGYITSMNVILGIIAFLLVIVGVIELVQGQLVFGLVLIVAGLLIGPGGFTINRSRAR